jgi:hypothetical protein
METNIKPGKYRHFKGVIHEILGVAKHTEDHNKEFVVYYHPDENGKNQLWVRPKEMFLEHIDRDGYKGPRFEYIGE